MNNNKTTAVILASGGLDSFLCWYIFEQDALNIFVDIGHKYVRKERAALRNLQNQYMNKYINK